MKRFLTPTPANRNVGQLAQITTTRFPKAIDVNEVDVNGTPNLAVYFEDADAPAAGALTSWRADVAAHVPTADANLTAASNLDTLRQRANAYLALPTPTAAQTAKATKALIRLTLGLLDDITDTA